jgi:hypothetical protein
LSNGVKVQLFQRFLSDSCDQGTNSLSRTWDLFPSSLNYMIEIGKYESLGA